MATKYNVFISTGVEATVTRARKDAAIAYGTAYHQGTGFRVVTDTGNVVHVVEADQVVEQEPQVEAEQVADEPTVDEVVEEAEATAEPTEQVFNIEAMKAKISKLLAKAEGTDNEAEREAFNAKAEALMVKLGIARAELESTGAVNPEEIVEVVRPYKGGYATAFVSFVHSVAAGFGDLTVLMSGRGSQRYAYLIGHKSDVEAVGQLLNSLELQAMSALHAWQKSAPEREFQDNNQRYVGSRSFLIGYGDTVGRRLAVTRKATVEETQVSTGAELVLASKADRLQSYMDEAYPKLGKARGGNAAYSGRGMAAGREAGQRADIGGTRVSGKSGSITA